MANYKKDEKVTVKSSTGKTLVWVATGDPQRDMALSSKYCLLYKTVYKKTIKS